MPEYSSRSVFDFFKDKDTSEPYYWISASSARHLVFFKVEQSTMMKKKGIIPQLYLEKKAGKVVAQRTANALGKSSVNMAVAINLANFAKGEHDISFQLFIDNISTPQSYHEYETISDWKSKVRRVWQ